jgi:hypothetical protein
MLSRIFFVCVLVAVTVIIHAVSLSALIRAAKSGVLPGMRILAVSWLLIRVAWSLVLIHTVEIAVWALFYVWQECLPDIETALYFSGVAYTTIGFGDVVLQKPWRLFGPAEGLTGLLMSGLSAALFVNLFATLLVRESGRES